MCNFPQHIKTVYPCNDQPVSNATTYNIPLGSEYDTSWFISLPAGNVESNPDPLISLYVLVACEPKLADPSDFCCLFTVVRKPGNQCDRVSRHCAGYGTAQFTRH